MNIFQRFINSGDILLRASIDEAYMDLTATCKKMTNESSNKDTNVAENNTEHTITVQEEKLVKKALSVSCVVGSVDINSPYDRLLINAAIIVKQIRDAVQNELGYSISAGIATNKLLAKIGSSKNKPRKQTIIPHRHGPAVLANLPVKGVSPPSSNYTLGSFLTRFSPIQVPGLGGKMGDTVCLFLKKYVKGIIGRTEAGSTEITKQMAIDFKISNDKDQVLIKALQYVSEPILKKEFGDATGAWLHRVAHGVDSEILNSRVKPKSLLAMKSFEPKHVDKEVIEWIKTLAGEVHERYLEDRQNFKRRPTNLVLHHRGTRSRDHLEKWKKGNNNATPTSTIRTSLPNISILTQEHIFNIGKKLFYKIEKRLPCSRIGLSMADFVDLPKMGKGVSKMHLGMH